MLSIISFTERGALLSLKLKDMLDKSGENTWLYTKCSKYRESGTDKRLRYIYCTTDEWAGVQMKAKNVLLFIGACGIAVRAIAPWLTSKLDDSPVLVMDELGMHIIPILSGHVGGANEIAVKIAEIAGAVPVITTATDINHCFAIDLFAKKNHLYIQNREGIAKVSSKILRGEKISIGVEKSRCHMPASGSRFINQIEIADFPPKQPVDVIITSAACGYDAKLVLRPREYVIGMGCRKDKEAQKIRDYIGMSMEELGIGINQVYALASIDRKKDETGFKQWSERERLPFITYSPEELMAVEGDFNTSEFVKSQVGVDNVCERAALKCSGRNGKLIYKKHAMDGMTIAVAKRDWRVSFDYE